MVVTSLSPPSFPFPSASPPRYSLFEVYRFVYMCVQVHVPCVCKYKPEEDVWLLHLLLYRSPV